MGLGLMVRVCEGPVGDLPCARDLGVCLVFPWAEGKLREGQVGDVLCVRVDFRVPGRQFGHLWPQVDVILGTCGPK